MKKLISTVAMASLLFLFVQCDSGEDEPYKCTNCNSAPEASPANDTKNKGIYKGVIIGSSGTLKFNINNSGSGVSAILEIDDAFADLTTTAVVNDGQAFNATFTGSLNGGSVSLTFTVGATGANPTVTSITVPGHPNISVVVAKEVSTSLLECFEGTYSSSEPEHGTFNILVSRSAGIWGGISRKDGEKTADGVSGSVSDNQLVSSGVVMGTIAGDEISGSFKSTGGFTVTVSGKRTM